MAFLLLGTWAEPIVGTVACAVAGIIGWVLFIERRITRLDARLRNGISDDIARLRRLHSDHAERLRNVELKQAANSGPK